MGVAVPKDKQYSVTFLCYVWSVFSHINLVLSWHIKLVDLPLRKIASFLWLVKDNLELKLPRVCSIPCECGQDHIKQRGCSDGTKLKEHHQHNQLEQWDKSAMTKHSISLGHCIQLHNTSTDCVCFLLHADFLL